MNIRTWIAGKLLGIRQKSLHGILPWVGQEAGFFRSNYRAAANEGYNKNVYVFTAIREVATSVAGIPWFLADKKGKIIESHPLLDLIAQPNPRMGTASFFEWLTSYFLISGNSYILRISPDTGTNAGKPRELWLLRPDRVEIIKGNRMNPVAGFKLRSDDGQDTPIPPEMILHLRTFNPLDDLIGVSPLAVGARSIVQSNESKAWNVSLLQNHARPPGAFVSKHTLTETQLADLRKEVDEKYTGSFNAGRPMLLGGEMTWQQFGMTPADMDWLEGQKLSAREISIIFGVPPELIGDSTNKTYSNYREARRAFHEETIMPFMVHLRDELNRWLVPLFGDNLFLDFDTDQVPALQEDRALLFERLSKATFLTENEKRKEAGFEERPEGDVILIPISSIPLGATTPEGSGHREEDDKKGVKQRKVQSVIASKERFSNAAAARKWITEHDFTADKVDETETSWRFRQFPPGRCKEDTLRTIRLDDGVSAVICEQKACVVDDGTTDTKAFNMTTQDQKHLYWKTFDRMRFQFLDRVFFLMSRRLRADFNVVIKAVKASATVDIIPAVVQSELIETRAKWEDLFKAVYFSVGEEFARIVFNRIKSTGTKLEGKEFEDAAFQDIWRAEIDAWLNSNATVRILGIQDTSIRQITAAVNVGIGEGEGVPKIAQRIANVRNTTVDVRARLIARTETISASNLGSQAAGVATSLPLNKEWIATPDALVREAHAEVDGQVVNGMDSAFVVDNEELLFPGDTSLGATGANIFNCRCTVGYLIADEEEFIRG